MRTEKEVRFALQKALENTRDSAYLQKLIAEAIDALDNESPPAPERSAQGFEALPDIGRDPLRFRDEESGKYIERLRNACAMQQSGVPDQTALVWRIDLSRIIGDLTLAESRLQSQRNDEGEGNRRTPKEV